MLTSLGTVAGDWDRSFFDELRRTDAVVVGTVSQPSSEMMVRLFADRSRLTRVGLRPAFLSSSACVARTRSRVWRVAWGSFHQTRSRVVSFSVLSRFEAFRGLEVLSRHDGRVDVIV
jgi:hypothetical protein